MGLTFRNVKRWIRMFCGKSIYHVNQDLGKHFVPGELKGFFNNLTEKVLKDDKTVLQKGGLPLLEIGEGKNVVFPVAVFQYGLGCYDLYLNSSKAVFRDKFLELSDWALDHQDENGGWNCFWYVYPDHPYGAMCQGEAASLLARAFKETGDTKYLTAAEKGLEFVLNRDIGATLFLQNDDDLVLLEYEDQPAVLNGWIFAAFGFYDVWLATKEEEYNEVFKRTIATLEKYLPQFDNSYWSMYDLGGRIASPFYHDLHIAQMQALAMIFENRSFRSFQKKFERYRKNPFKKLKALIVKANQKIKE